VIAAPESRECDASIRNVQPLDIEQVQVKLVTSLRELLAAQALRRAVFCDEQGLFDGDDADAIDARALTLVAIARYTDGREKVVGTVRIHEESPRIWYGSRLAVVRQARRHHDVGSGLIRLAVTTAHARGCEEFLAHVQSQNVPLFEKLHWRGIKTLELHGRPHTLMNADLSYYPPNSDSALLLSAEKKGTGGTK